MKTLFFLIILSAIGYFAYCLNDFRPEIKNKLFDILNIGSFHTLEVKYTSKQIMENKKIRVLKDEKHSFLEPIIKFHPYLLMEVKYLNNEKKTIEGIILWDLIDGEMVIDEKNWEKTHGFSDCINAKAAKTEFKIINLLSQNGGSIDRNGIIKLLNVENDVLDSWIDSCRRKKLIVQNGNEYKLHMQNPKLKVSPTTSICAPLVTKNCSKAERLPKRYSFYQIKKIAQNAFGDDFSIRNVIDVYLPIYSITIQNPDGSFNTSHWNALNGKTLTDVALIE